MWSQKDNNIDYLVNRLVSLRYSLTATQTFALENPEIEAPKDKITGTDKFIPIARKGLSKRVFRAVVYRLQVRKK